MRRSVPRFFNDLFLAQLPSRSELSNKFSTSANRLYGNGNLPVLVSWDYRTLICEISLAIEKVLPYVDGWGFQRGLLDMVHFSCMYYSIGNLNQM